MFECLQLTDGYVSFRKEKIRSKAVWVWWSDQASLSQKGQDDKEDCIEAAVSTLQGSTHASAKGVD